MPLHLLLADSFFFVFVWGSTCTTIFLILLKSLDTKLLRKVTNDCFFHFEAFKSIFYGIALEGVKLRNLSTNHAVYFISGDHLYEI